MRESMRHILVTGANGHLGRPVCDALAAAGYEVRGTDLRNRRGDSRRTEVADLLDRESCYRLVRGVDAVVHLANHPGNVLPDGQRVFLENVTMTANVVLAAMEEDVQKLVYSSSVQVISGEPSQGAVHPGEPDMICRFPYLPLDGDLPPQPGNPYALSKRAGEELLAYAARATDMQCIAIRFPWLIRESVSQWRDKVRPWGPHAYHRQMNEAFSNLTLSDAAALVARILPSDLPGFRTYLPASRALLVDTPVAELLAGVYAEVPRRVAGASLAGLVDLTRITEDTGWEPSE